jgi:hypothetical protein
VPCRGLEHSLLPLCLLASPGNPVEPKLGGQVAFISVGTVLQYKCLMVKYNKGFKQAKHYIKTPNNYNKYLNCCRMVSLQLQGLFSYM